MSANHTPLSEINAAMNLMRARRDEAQQLAAAAPELLAALIELHAMVKGECPSLLNEDSGGNGRLAMQIEDAISKATGSTS